ncbi:Arg81p KNAG_0J00210 [Huiozyma naganishii CBS 8797]|uniref:Zn(2)-C6 fungal-type domain-containing protein n=1 Tax=Huiozyma naganishii (strain ATCC MYA-139 / BCRC 22969 / CBS 8797 / KCTC 17520 / NBRC 10181 / NCYC 3082 / Yp74L-3) TaxID=1071383 RepID=J7S9G9_HUIN7|nr:hypothetical protein KNAG_0J00210 [Kazachstania naganishii CBS 8797]CCK72104.1 hypothetical protein KNAG_0J00210 [Kazachstania naganishii CBS 8797]
MTSKQRRPRVKARPRRAKTFTGCWTCRSRKVKCDLRRPGCLRCEKSSLECGGYDIKLRWSELVRFDSYGVQMAPAANELSSLKSQNEPLFQRRNIDFVKYDEEYVYHEDMDDELSALHCPPPEKIADNKTWIIKKFGVFRGREPEDKQNPPRKRRRKTAPAKNTSAKNSVSNTPLQSVTPIPPPLAPPLEQTQQETLSPQQQLVDDASSSQKGANSIPGYNFISSELREDFLLSAFAFQGAPIDNLQIDELNSTINQANAGNSPELSSQTLESTGEQAINHLIRSLFHHTGEVGPAASSTEPADISSVHVPIIRHISSRDTDSYLPLGNSITINSPTLDSHMPRTAMEILPSQISDKSLLEKFKSVDERFVIPTTGLFVHGIARFLLSYYYNTVADLMTVVPIKKNPWKTLYFPRALSALGDLAGLGDTSNSRNSLLNALLAVSCFNLQSKFEKNSKEQKYFLNLGIEFRSQASSFLRLCLKNSVDEERYKDVLTAILSMNSIDVVWGTMTDCQDHLTVCEDFIEKRMKNRPHLSEKARTLHRIFSFLKLIQDSTALDKVRKKEIVFLEGAFSTPGESGTASVSSNPPSTLDRSSEDGLFRESVNQRDGKIQIKFVKEAETPSLASAASISPPMFPNIASESYYVKNDEKLRAADTIGTDAIYGLPYSLILLFSDCVLIARHNEYYNMKYVSVPREFTNLSLKFEKRLMKWKPEWSFFQDKDNLVFISDKIEAIYHHTMSFYFGLIIYYFTMVRSLNNAFLQTYVVKVLRHLQKLSTLIKEKKVQLVPLIWQGFIAGCSCTDVSMQAEFRIWAASLAESGMGSYWGARQIMYEVWRRRANEDPGDNWYSVYKDWEMNLMLS